MNNRMNPSRGPSFVRMWWCAALAALALLWTTPAVAQDDEYTDEEGRTVAEMPALPPPDTQAGKQLAWILSVLNGAPLGGAAERFNERFLEQFTGDQLEKELKSLRAGAFKNKTVDIVRVLGEGKDDSIEVVIRGKGTKRVLSLFLVTDEKNGKIAGLLFGPAGGFSDDGEEAEMADWDQYTGDMGEMKGSASFGAYELVPRDKDKPAGPYLLSPIHEFGEDERLAIGSSFKLWILGALAEEVAAGRLAWDQPVTVRESFKSLPSGTMQLEPPGTPHPLAYFAAQMISISDNTATDHLLHLVGREKVEAYMATVHSMPGLNKPMISTREMFTIKLSADRDLLERYASGDELTRREMLAEGGEVYTGVPSIILASAWKKPVGVDRVEWFAGPHDCCRAMADLRRLEQLPGMAQLGAVLRKNPGLPQKSGVWKSVGFKGGSEPGVMNLTFLLERTDGRWFTLSAGWNDTMKPLEEIKLVEMAQRGIDMLAGFEFEKDAEEPAVVPTAEKPW